DKDECIYQVNTIINQYEDLGFLFRNGKKCDFYFKLSQKFIRFLYKENHFQYSLYLMKMK
ncbi:hypothetical protein, partial [Veillonella seminalis]|uniref:hypothetical protein n=1 Tax=Veillonella seminalis TaxID=1502943 RepID=UPI0023F7C11A